MRDRPARLQRECGEHDAHLAGPNLVLSPARGHGHGAKDSDLHVTPKPIQTDGAFVLPETVLVLPRCRPPERLPATSRRLFLPMIAGWGGRCQVTALLRISGTDQADQGPRQSPIGWPGGSPGETQGGIGIVPMLSEPIWCKTGPVSIKRGSNRRTFGGGHFMCVDELGIGVSA